VLSRIFADPPSPRANAVRTTTSHLPFGRITGNPEVMPRTESQRRWPEVSATQVPSNFRASCLTVQIVAEKLARGHASQAGFARTNSGRASALAKLSAQNRRHPKEFRLFRWIDSRKLRLG
jgi:hypothetical protein